MQLPLSDNKKAALFSEGTTISKMMFSISTVVSCQPVTSAESDVTSVWRALNVLTSILKSMGFELTMNTTTDLLASVFVGVASVVLYHPHRYSHTDG